MLDVEFGMDGRVKFLGVRMVFLAGANTHGVGLDLVDSGCGLLQN